MSRKVFIFKNSGPAHSSSIDFKQLVIHVVQQPHSQGVTYESWVGFENSNPARFRYDSRALFLPRSEVAPLLCPFHQQWKPNISRTFYHLYYCLCWLCSRWFVMVKKAMERRPDLDSVVVWSVDDLRSLYSHCSSLLHTCAQRFVIVCANFYLGWDLV